MERRQKN